MQRWLWVNALIMKELAMPRKPALQILLLSCVIMLLTVVPAQALFSGQNGKGTSANPFRISTIAQWQQLESDDRHWDKQYILQNDLDFAGEERTPVGTFLKPFTGRFNGNDKTLKNFKLSTPEVDNGLFGMIGTGGRVISLTLENVLVGGGGSSGALAGRVREGGIDECHVREVQVHGHTVGGLVGKLEGTKLEECSAEGQVQSTGPSGGLVGAALPWDNGAGALISEIRQCEVSGGKATGTRQIGGLVGLSEAAQIFDCTVDAEVEGTDKVGGLAGHQIRGFIAGCTVQADCSASDDVGGIAGLIEGESWIQFSSFTGQVTCAYENGGGLAGRSLEGSFNSCTVDGTVTGKDYTGGLVGKASDSFFQFCEFDGTVFGSTNTGGFVGFLTASNVVFGEVKGSVTGKQETGGIVGHFEDGGIQTSRVESSVLGLASYTGGIAGYSEDAIITDVEVDNNVQGLGSYTGGGIGYIESTFVDKVTIDSDVQGGSKTGGLFGAAAHFTAVLECDIIASVLGGEHTGGVAGEIRQSDLSFVHVEGQIQGTNQVGGAVGLVAENSNFTEVVSFATVTGEVDTGGLVGLLENGAVTLCYGFGTVKGTTYTGGVVGRAEEGSLRRSSSIRSVKGGEYTGGFAGASKVDLDRVYSGSKVTGQKYVGGLVGHGEGKIIYSNATGRVMGNEMVGGLVGLYDSGNMTSCYAQGDVFAQKDGGGLIGNNAAQGLLKDCYARGAVQGGEALGGLIGDNSGFVVNSYATGRVSGQRDLGGLIGKGSPLNVADCYWNTESSGMDTSVGGHPATTAQMRFPFDVEIYADWDFDEVWDYRDDYIINQGFPYLQKNTNAVVPIEMHPLDVDQNWIIDEIEKDMCITQWQQSEMPMETAMRALYIFEKGGQYSYEASLLPPMCWIPLED